MKECKAGTERCAVHIVNVVDVHPQMFCIEGCNDRVRERVTKNIIDHELWRGSVYAGDHGPETDDEVALMMHKRKVLLCVICGDGNDSRVRGLLQGGCRNCCKYSEP